MAYLQSILLFLCLSMATQSFAHVPPPAGPSFSLLHEACSKTSNVDKCIETLMTKPASQSADHKGLIAISIRMAAEVAAGIAVDISRTLNTAVNDKALWLCLDQCSHSFKDAISRLDISMAALDIRAIVETVRWVHSAIGDIETCDRGCTEVKGEVKARLIKKMEIFRMQCGITLQLAGALG